MVWLANERRLALFPVGTIVKRFATSGISNRPRAGFEPVRNLSSGLVE